ncbi:hypothetical protein, conserved [Plasmodium vivax]|uniref:VIR protein n=1 Tax=Plasmodium vivax TaxID=5855 RepID=A0A1G4ED92_PLAVI|nr:hypothetical protein, conserved [Plasmodium vivax]
MSQDRTVESEVDDMVLTFEKYIEFQKKFADAEKFASDTVTLNEILKRAKITGDDKNHYLKAFDILLKLIHQDGLFIKDENPEICKYINYLLYGEVERKKHRSYNQKLISLFHKFSVAYGEEHGNQKRCVSKIYSIKDETYNKINALYHVYDNYKKCYLFKEQTIRDGCNFFDDFFASYDNYIRNNGSKSLKFNQILENIEKYAKDSFTLYKKGCEKYKDNPRSPQLFEPPPEPKLEIHTQVHKGQTVLHSVDNIPQYTSHGITNTLQTELTSDIPRSPREHENQRRDQGNIVNIDHSANDIHPRTSRQETRVPPIREDEEETHMFSGYPNHLEHSYSSGTSFYPIQYEHVEEQALSKKVELPPSSVMSTITSALSDVQPGPVLGVSGGMGVLFLLFKLDPSLEEEEDDSVKFPVVSMDHSQENSHIFKIMKVDILDMVQRVYLLSLNRPCCVISS